MAKTPDPYSRVYWTVLDDARFDGIRGNMAHLGTWLLLLLVADMAHPAPAFLPPAPRKSVAALRDVGLIELMGGGRYRVHGLAAERDRRSSAGNAGASARWSERNANAMRTHTEPDAIGMLDETRRDEPRQDEDEPWLRAWLSVRMRMPTARQREVIESYLRTFDETGDERAASLFLRHPDDPLGALIADLKSFRAEAAGEAVKAEEEAKVRRKDQRRGFRPGTVEYELAQMLKGDTSD